MSSTRRVAIRRLELHISYDCLQSCLFCSESSRLARFQRLPLRAAEIARLLALKRRLGFDHLTLTGGEPTLYPALPGVLAAAKRLGFRTYVTSNGARLAEERFAGLVLPLIDELCLSVHGDSSELHDSIVRRPGAFWRLQRALRRASSWPGLFLLTNTVVIQRNWSRLGGILRFILAQGGVRHCLLSQVAPEGRGASDYGRNAVPFAAWRRQLPGLARLADRHGVALRVFGLPLCVLGRRLRCSNDLFFSPRATIERGTGPTMLLEIVSLRPTRRRIHLPVCAGCAARQACGGVFRRHAELLGVSGVRALPRTRFPDDRSL